MTRLRSEDIVHRLLDLTECPACGEQLGEGPLCPTCHRELGGEGGWRVVVASRNAVAALRRRDELIDALPFVAAPVGYTPTPAFPPPPGFAPPVPPAPPTPRPESRSQVSVQSVLAVLGAALVAVAALVFTFLNPDLTDFGVRTTIIAATTVVFLVGAGALMRAKLRFSAEAIGALGMLFVALDIWAFASSAVRGSTGSFESGWLAGGLATAVAAAILLVIARLARLRTWLWASTVAFALVPAFVGYASGDGWGIVCGHLGVLAVLLIEHGVLRRLQSRFESALAPERGTATALALTATLVLFVQVLALGLQPVFESNSGADGVWLRQAAAFLAIGLLAAAAARTQLAAVWSVAAGAFPVIAAVTVPLGLLSHDVAGNGTALLALTPLVAAAGTVTAALLARLLLGWPARHGGLGGIVGTNLAFGAWAISLAVSLPAAFGWVLGSAYGPGGSSWMLWDALGLAATAAGTWALALVGRRRTVFAAGSWIAALAIAEFLGWQGLPATVRVLVALALAAALCVALLRVPRIRRSSLRLRAPLATVARLAIVFAGFTVATDVNPGTEWFSVAEGAIVVAAIVVVSRLAPARFGFIHTAVGFAFALLMFARALEIAQIEPLAILCLTTSLASAAALVVTLIRRLDAGFWYAVLGVASVPFVIGIVSVLFERSGWTALSTGFMFALAVTVMVTTRPGLNRYLRQLAAALLVPALAVVVICLGAQLLTASASPVTLPIIAVIVALALAAAEPTGELLVRRGLAAVDARGVVQAIEASTLVTAALAVLLSLVRNAAGLGTAFIVLLIVGTGALVTSLIGSRRYTWVVTAAAFTGAMWCVWAIAGVTILEPYILPPAIGAVVVGAVGVARRLSSLALYAVGLACAVIPSLVVLAVSGELADGSGLWRVGALLAASVLLIAVSMLVDLPWTRESLRRLAALRVPTLGAAAAAACAGTIQAVRYGMDADPSPSAPSWSWGLALTLVSTALALLAAARLVRGTDALSQRITASRWTYGPAATALTVGAAVSVRANFAAVGAALVVLVALLTWMLVTTARARSRAVTQPPVWFLFILAWVVAVAAWSPRVLRVEAFSLPLGFALLAAGAIAMGTKLQPTSRLLAWPNGSTGSWALLTPGIVVTLLPSTLATATDPVTIRAILVIALALVAILIGSLRKLAAPFVIGIVALPVENITVFASQFGREIGATPWWITLATAGAVLLVIAVTWERRAGGGGVAARMRDLR